jgi:hypothetical protein
MFSAWGTDTLLAGIEPRTRTGEKLAQRRPGSCRIEKISYICRKSTPVFRLTFYSLARSCNVQIIRFYVLHLNDYFKHILRACMLCYMKLDNITWGTKTWTVFARSESGIVGSNHTQGMDVCVHLFCFCVVQCLGSGLSTVWSLVQGALPTK